MKRLSLVDQCETELEKRLKSKAYGDKLPGFRFLAESLGVSIPTVMRAAGRLVDRGMLVSQGPRRALRIEAKAILDLAGEDGEGKGGARGLLVVTDMPWERLSPNTRAIIKGMEGAAREKNMGFRCAHMVYRDAAGTHKAWDRLLGSQPSSHLLATMGSDAVVSWAKSHGLKVALLGGRTSDRNTPVFGVSAAAVLTEAIRRLRARGHRRILIPCFDAPQMLFRTLAAAAAKAQETDEAELARSGLIFAEPRVDSEVALQRVLAGLRETGATALVTMSFRDYQLFATGMMRAGIRLPGDVSMVCLIGDPEAEFIRPRPAHFQAPMDAMLTRLRRWLHKDVRSQAGLGTGWLERAWVEGESLGEAAAKQGTGREA